MGTLTVNENRLFYGTSIEMDGSSDWDAPSCCSDSHITFIIMNALRAVTVAFLDVGQAFM